MDQLLLLNSEYPYQLGQPPRPRWTETFTEGVYMRTNDQNEPQFNIRPYARAEKISKDWTSEQQERLQFQHKRMQMMVDLASGRDPLEVALSDPDVFASLKKGTLPLNRMAMMGETAKEKPINVYERDLQMRKFESLGRIDSEKYTGQVANRNWMEEAEKRAQRMEQAMNGPINTSTNKAMTAREASNAIIAGFAHNSGRSVQEVQKDYPSFSDQQVNSIIDPNHVNVTLAPMGAGKSFSAGGWLINNSINYPEADVANSLNLASTHATRRVMANTLATTIPYLSQKDQETIRERTATPDKNGNTKDPFNVRTFWSSALSDLTKTRVLSGGYKTTALRELEGGKFADYVPMGFAAKRSASDNTPFESLGDNQEAEGEEAFVDAMYKHFQLNPKTLSKKSAIDYVNNMKQRRALDQAKYNQALIDGKNAWFNGQRSNPNAFFYAYEQAKVQNVVQGNDFTVPGYTQPMMDKRDILRLATHAANTLMDEDGTPLIPKAKTVWADELQDLPEDALGYIKSRTDANSRILFTGDMGQKTIENNVDVPRIIQERFNDGSHKGGGIGTHTFTGNYRQAATNSSFLAAVGAEKALANIPNKSPSSVSMRNDFIPFPSISYGKTYDEAFRPRIQQWFMQQGLSMGQIKRNVQAGNHPLAGAFAPGQAPFIATMHPQLDQIESQVYQYMQEQLGPELAPQVMKEMVTRSNPTPGNEHQMRLLTTAQARGMSFGIPNKVPSIGPTVDVTQAGAWEYEGYLQQLQNMAGRASGQQYLIGTGVKSGETEHDLSPDRLEYKGKHLYYPHGFKPIISRMVNYAVNNEGISWNQVNPEWQQFRNNPYIVPESDAIESFNVRDTAKNNALLAAYKRITGSSGEGDINDPAFRNVLETMKDAAQYGFIQPPMTGASYLMNGDEVELETQEDPNGAQAIDGYTIGTLDPGTIANRPGSSVDAEEIRLARLTLSDIMENGPEALARHGYRDIPDILALLKGRFGRPGTGFSLESIVAPTEDAKKDIAKAQNELVREQTDVIRGIKNPPNNWFEADKTVTEQLNASQEWRSSFENGKLKMTPVEKTDGKISRSQTEEELNAPVSSGDWEQAKAILRRGMQRKSFYTVSGGQNVLEPYFSNPRTILDVHELAENAGVTSPFKNMTFVPDANLINMAVETEMRSRQGRNDFLAKKAMEDGKPYLNYSGYNFDPRKVQMSLSQKRTLTMSQAIGDPTRHELRNQFYDEQTGTMSIPAILNQALKIRQESDEKYKLIEELENAPKVDYSLLSSKERTQAARERQQQETQRDLLAVQAKRQRREAYEMVRGLLTNPKHVEKFKRGVQRFIDNPGTTNRDDNTALQAQVWQSAAKSAASSPTPQVIDSFVEVAQHLANPELYREEMTALYHANPEDDARNQLRDDYKAARYYAEMSDKYAAKNAPLREQMLSEGRVPEYNDLSLREKYTRDSIDLPQLVPNINFREFDEETGDLVRPSLRYTPEMHAQLMQTNPRVAMRLARMFGGIPEGPGIVVSDQEKGIDKEVALSDVLATQKGMEHVGYSYGEARYAPTVVAMQAYFQSLNNPGNTDRKVTGGGVYRPDGSGQLVQMDILQKSLEEEAATLEAQNRPELASIIKEKYDQAQQIERWRIHMNDPETPRRYGLTAYHVMNAALGGRTREDAKNKENAFFSNLKNPFAPNSRTLGTIGNVMGSLERAMTHLQQTGTLKRSHILDVISAFGHKPDNNMFQGLRRLEKDHNFRSDDAEISLAQLFDMNTSDEARTNAMPASIQYPFRSGDAVTIARGAMNATTQRGLVQGMRGTIHALPYLNEGQLIQAQTHTGNGGEFKYSKYANPKKEVEHFGSPRGFGSMQRLGLHTRDEVNAIKSRYKNDPKILAGEERITQKNTGTPYLFKAEDGREFPVRPDQLDLIDNGRVGDIFSPLPSSAALSQLRTTPILPEDKIPYPHRGVFYTLDESEKQLDKNYFTKDADAYRSRLFTHSNRLLSAMGQMAPSIKTVGIPEGMWTEQGLRPKNNSLWGDEAALQGYDQSGVFRQIQRSIYNFGNDTRRILSGKKRETSPFDALLWGNREPRRWTYGQSRFTPEFRSHILNNIQAMAQLRPPKVASPLEEQMAIRMSPLTSGRDEANRVRSQMKAMRNQMVAERIRRSQEQRRAQQVVATPRPPRSQASSPSRQAQQREAAAAADPDPVGLSQREQHDALFEQAKDVLQKTGYMSEDVLRQHLGVEGPQAFSIISKMSRLGLVKRDPKSTARIWYKPDHPALSKKPPQTTPVAEPASESEPEQTPYDRLWEKAKQLASRNSSLSHDDLMRHLGIGQREAWHIADRLTREGYVPQDPTQTTSEIRPLRGESEESFRGRQQMEEESSPSAPQQVEPEEDAVDRVWAKVKQRASWDKYLTRANIMRHFGVGAGHAFHFSERLKNELGYIAQDPYQPHAGSAIQPSEGDSGATQSSTPPPPLQTGGGTGGNGGRPPIEPPTSEGPPPRPNGPEFSGRPEPLSQEERQFAEEAIPFGEDQSLEPPTLEAVKADIARFAVEGNQFHEIMKPTENEQLPAITGDERVKFIRGGPGGGKTATAVSAAMYAMSQDPELAPENILAVSALNSAKTALNEKLGNFIGAMPNEARYKTEAKTFHQIAHSALFNHYEDPTTRRYIYPTLSAMGMDDYSPEVLEQKNQEELDRLTPSEREEAENNSQARFVLQSLKEAHAIYGFKNEPPRNTHIDLKQISDWQKLRLAPNDPRVGTNADEYARVWNKGFQDLKHGIMSDEAKFVAYNQGKERHRRVDHDDVLYHGTNAIEDLGEETLPRHLRNTGIVVADEAQDLTKGNKRLLQAFLRAIRRNKPKLIVSYDTAQSQMENLGGYKTNEIIPQLTDMARQGTGAEPSHHTLTINHRSDAGVVAGINAVIRSNALKGTVVSPEQTPGNPNIGKPDTFTMRKSQPALYRAMLRDMVKATGVPVQTIKENMLAGRMAFHGVDFEQPGLTAPKDIAGIVLMKKQQDLVDRAARDMMMNDWGLSREQADKMAPLLFRRGPLPHDARKNEKALAEHQLQIIRMGQARSLGFKQTFVDATNVGGWRKDEAEEQASFMRNLLIGASREKSGGQNHFYGATHPFPTYKISDYLDTEPGQGFYEEHPEELYGKVYLNGNPVSLDRQFNSPSKVNGQWVPQGLEEMQRGKQAQLKEWIDAGLVQAPDGYKKDTPPPQQNATEVSYASPEIQNPSVVLGQPEIGQQDTLAGDGQNVSLPPQLATGGGNIVGGGGGNNNRPPTDNLPPPLPGDQQPPERHDPVMFSALDPSFGGDEIAGEHKTRVRGLQVRRPEQDEKIEQGAGAWQQITQGQPSVSMGALYADEQKPQGTKSGATLRSRKPQGLPRPSEEEMRGQGPNIWKLISQEKAPKLLDLMTANWNQNEPTLRGFTPLRLHEVMQAHNQRPALQQQSQTPIRLIDIIKKNREERRAQGKGSPFKSIAEEWEATQQQMGITNTSPKHLVSIGRDLFSPSLQKHILQYQDSFSSNGKPRKFGDFFKRVRGGELPPLPPKEEQQPYATPDMDVMKQIEEHTQHQLLINQNPYSPDKNISVIGMGPIFPAKSAQTLVSADGSIGTPPSADLNVRPGPIPLQIHGPAPAPAQDPIMEARWPIPPSRQGAPIGPSTQAIPADLPIVVRTNTPPPTAWGKPLANPLLASEEQQVQAPTTPPPAPASTTSAETMAAIAVKRYPTVDDRHLGAVTNAKQGVLSLPGLEKIAPSVPIPNFWLDAFGQTRGPDNKPVPMSAQQQNTVKVDKAVIQANNAEVTGQVVKDKSTVAPGSLQYSEDMKSYKDILRTLNDSSSGSGGKNKVITGDGDPEESKENKFNGRQIGHEMARIGGELQFIGVGAQQLADQALAQGSAYRRATLLMGSGGSTGTEGYFDFANQNSGINRLQRQVPMFSLSEVAAQMQGTSSSMNTQLNVENPTRSILALSAMTGLNSTELTNQLMQITGSAGQGKNLNATPQIAGMLDQMYGGNLSALNVGPTLSALQAILPTVQGINLGSGDQTQSIMNLFKAAVGGGMTAQNLPQVAQMMGTLATIGTTPNLQQQAFLQNLFPNEQLTAAPEMANYQAQQSENAMQVQQLRLRQQYDAEGMQISINNAEIKMEKANLDMGGIQLQAQQVQLQGAQLQQDYNTASYNLKQRTDIELYGDIGQDTSRQGYFNFMRSQAAAGYDPTSPENAQYFKAGNTFGIENAKFYAGVEHQRQDMVLGRSSLLSDAKFNEDLKYLNEQETFYNEELKVRNEQRAFERDWTKRLLDQQQKSIDMQQKALDQQKVIYDLQKERYALDVQRNNFENANLELQKSFIPQQIKNLESISQAMQQQLEGQGPLGGGFKTPQDIIRQLSLVKDDKQLNSLIAQAVPVEQRQTLYQLIKDINAQGGYDTVMAGKTKDDKALQDRLNKMLGQGAFADKVNAADIQNAFLTWAGKDDNWKHLVDSFKTSADSLKTIATLLAPFASIVEKLGMAAPIGAGLMAGATAVNTASLIAPGLIPGIGQAGSSILGTIGGGSLLAGGVVAGGAALNIAGGIMGWNDYNVNDDILHKNKGVDWGRVLGKDLIPAYEPLRQIHKGWDMIANPNTRGQVGQQWNDMWSWLPWNQKQGNNPNLMASITGNGPDGGAMILGAGPGKGIDWGKIGKQMQDNWNSNFGPKSPIAVFFSTTIPKAWHDLLGTMGDNWNSNFGPKSPIGKTWNGFIDSAKNVIGQGGQNWNNFWQKWLPSWWGDRGADWNNTWKGIGDNIGKAFNDSISSFSKAPDNILNAFKDGIKGFFNVPKGQSLWDAIIQKAGSFFGGGGGNNNQGGGSFGGGGGGGAENVGGILMPHINTPFHQPMWYGELHQGIDLQSAQGTPLREFTGGMVQAAGWKPWGGEVDVRVPGGLTERYLHLSNIGVHPGQMINRGQLIGATGGGTIQSGLGFWSSGAHLHLQFDRNNINAGIDPIAVLRMLGDKNIYNMLGNPISGAASVGGISGGLAHGGVGLELKPGQKPPQTREEFLAMIADQENEKEKAKAQFAKGGVAMRRMTADVAETEPEAIIPLSRLIQTLSQITSPSSSHQSQEIVQPVAKQPTQVTVSKLAERFELHVHTSSASLDEQAKDALMAQLLDILGDTLNKFNGGQA